jgi:hypothetical protein
METFLALRGVVLLEPFTWYIGPKRDEVTREQRKLHNEELNDLYSSPGTIRVI